MHSKARSKVVYLDFDWFWIWSESLRKTLTNSDQPRPDCRWASQILLSSSCYRLSQVTIECWDAVDLKNGITCPWQCYRFDVRYHIDIIPSSLEGFGFFTWWISPLIYGWQLSCRKKVAAFCFLPETLASMHFCGNWERLGRFPISTMVETATLATFFEVFWSMAALGVTVNDSFVAVPTPIRDDPYASHCTERKACESQREYRPHVQISLMPNVMKPRFTVSVVFLVIPTLLRWMLASFSMNPCTPAAWTAIYCWRRLWSHFEYTFETLSLV